MDGWLMEFVAGLSAKAAALALNDSAQGPTVLGAVGG